MSQPETSLESPPPSSDGESDPQSSVFQIRKVVDRVMADYWNAVMRNLTSPRPLTGIERLDELTCGLGPGVHIVAGRPSMAKTSLMLSMIQKMCVDDKLPCLIFSGDHSALHLTHRLVFSRAWLPTRIIYAVASCPDESEKRALREAASEIAAAPLFIDDSFDLSVESIQGIATRCKHDNNIGFIAIENLEMLRTNFTRIELSREREVVEIVARLRGLARELDIPILLIAGLNKGSGFRNSPMGFPSISDLPYHNLIQGLAMTVALLYRPSYYAENHEDQERLKGSIKMILCKNSYGITHDIDLTFDESCSRFEDMSPDWIE
jgi:replicative DNA helicase